ncbi:MAG: putative zinc-binding metallopeptidase [Prevotella sp.]|nr:putative zinc-binding metallopeptidase [Prevotella sp.]
MRNISLMLLMAVTAGLYSCSGDDDLDSTSVFDKISVEEKNEFDNWLEENYRKVYNIDYKYRYSDNESDLSYNVIPAEFDKSKALAILVKHVWLEAYSEAVNTDFMKTYSPRIIQLTGSYKWNSNGSQVMGTAEGGLKIMFYGVNELDIDNPRINTTNPYENRNVKPIDMNYWFFHTMHHEFCHILTQIKDYDTSFRTISAATYHSTDWINLDDKKVAKEGFVSAYASSEYNEDFAEVYATYVTNSPEGWERIMTQAGSSGSAIITQKLDLMKKYFKSNWDLDLDTLRDIVVRRSSESTSLDLRNLN